MRRQVNGWTWHVVQGNRCNLKRGVQDDVRLQEVAVQLSWKAGCNGGSNEGRCCVIATMFSVRMSTCRTNLNRWIKVLKLILNTVSLFCCLVNCSQTHLADCNSVWLQKLDDGRSWLQMHRWDFKAPIAAGLRVNGDAAGPEVRSVWGELQSILRRYCIWSSCETRNILKNTIGNSMSDFLKRFETFWNKWTWVQQNDEDIIMHRVAFTTHSVHCKWDLEDCLGTLLRKAFMHVLLLAQQTPSTANSKETNCKWLQYISLCYSLVFQGKRSLQGGDLAADGHTIADRALCSILSEVATLFHILSILYICTAISWTSCQGCSWNATIHDLFWAPHFT